MRKLRASSRKLIRKLGLPGPPRAHTPPHVLFDSQHYSTLSYSSLGSYFSFLFFTFLRQFNLMYLHLKSAPRKRHWWVSVYKKNCLSFYLDETHASEMNWIRSGPPSECTKRSILGKDISEKNIYIAYTAAASSCFWGIRSPRSMLGRRRCPMKSRELSRRRLDYIYQSSRYDSGQHVPGYTSYSSIHFQVFMVLLPLNRIKPLDLEAFLAGQT